MRKFSSALLGGAALFALVVTPVAAQQGADPDNSENELGEGSREAVENPGDVSIRDQRAPVEGAGSVQGGGGMEGAEGADAETETLGEGSREAVEDSPSAVSQRDANAPVAGAGSRQVPSGPNAPGEAGADEPSEALGEENEESVEGGGANEE